MPETKQDMKRDGIGPNRIGAKRAGTMVDSGLVGHGMPPCHTKPAPCTASLRTRPARLVR
jgi:hypothetical protein